MLPWEMTDWDITSNAFPPCGIQMVTPMVTGAETLHWESTDWATAANVRHRQQETQILTNTWEDASLADAIDQSLYPRPEAAVESHPQPGSWMGEDRSVRI